MCVRLQMPTLRELLLTNATGSADVDALKINGPGTDSCRFENNSRKCFSFFYAGCHIDFLKFTYLQTKPVIANMSTTFEA